MPVSISSKVRDQRLQADRETVIRCAKRSPGDRTCLRAALQTSLLHGVWDSRTDREPRSSSNTQTRSKVTLIWRLNAIVQLEVRRNLNPEGLATRSHSQYIEGTSLLEMIRERSGGVNGYAVESYNEIIRYRRR